MKTIIKIWLWTLYVLFIIVILFVIVDMIIFILSVP